MFRTRLLSSIRNLDTASQQLVFVTLVMLTEHRTNITNMTISVAVNTVLRLLMMDSKSVRNM